MMNKVISLFKFKSFSPKQKKILTWWRDDSPVKDKDGIIADGSIRSGKTLSMSLSFVMWGMETFENQNFGMCGKTIGAFRRNVLFWLKLMLKSRGYQVKDYRADNYISVTFNGLVNYFYIFGGKDERSQDLIQGMTLAGCLFDEVALMPQSFVTQAMGRCSIDDSKWWFNCNPESPQHWFYINYIKKHKKLNLMYLHFTMDDNYSLSEKIKDRYRNMFAGLFYERLILGLWVVAHGIIYSMFNKDFHVVKTEPRPYEKLYIANDHGSQHPNVFLLLGLSNGVWYVVKEYYHNGEKDGQKTADEYYSDLIDFAKGYNIKQMILDNAPIAASFNVLLRRKRDFSSRTADNEVAQGIQDVSSALKQGILKVNDVCINLIREFGLYSWNEKSIEECPIKENDDALDCLRYLIRTLKIAVPKRKSFLE